MDQIIAHSDHEKPFYLRMRNSISLRHLPCRFSDNFKFPDNGADAQFIRNKFCLRIFADIPLDLFYRSQNVRKICLFRSNFHRQVLPGE